MFPKVDLTDFTLHSFNKQKALPAGLNHCVYKKIGYCKTSAQYSLNISMLNLAPLLPADNPVRQYTMSPLSPNEGISSGTLGREGLSPTYLMTCPMNVILDPHIVQLSIKRIFLMFCNHIHVPRFLTAVVFILATSDPAPCSLTPRQAT